MPHSEIECIAYEINTFPKEVENAKMLGAVLQVDLTMTYSGDSDPKADADLRIALMKEALDAAYAASPNAHKSDVLKLFMAPEFYFRGAKGAYGFDTYDYLVEKLCALVKQPKFDDWLVVFGSLLIAFELAPTRAAVDGIAVGGKTQRVQNVVLIQEGGSAGATRVVVKEHMSGIDFVRTSAGFELVDPTFSMKTRLSAGLDLGSVSHVPSGKTGAGKELQTKEYDGLGIFGSRGVCYGVEICLDHGEGRLRKSPVGKGQSYVQVQLIPSAGMSITDTAVVAMKDGIVFNCDGNSRSEVKVVTAAASGRDPSGLKGVGVHSRKHVHQSGGGAMMATRAFADTTTAQIKFYDKVSLPPATARGRGLFD